MNDEDWGQWIRAIRQRAGLTQEVLADKIGVSRRLVLAWEAGDHVPGGKHLIGVFKACGVRLEEAPQPPQPEPPRPQTRAEVIRAVEGLTAQMADLVRDVRALADDAEHQQEEASGS